MTVRLCGHSSEMGECCAGCFDVQAEQLADANRKAERYREVLERITNLNKCFHALPVTSFCECFICIAKAALSASEAPEGKGE